MLNLGTKGIEELANSKEYDDINLIPSYEKLNRLTQTSNFLKLYEIVLEIDEKYQLRLEQVKHIDRPQSSINISLETNGTVNQKLKAIGYNSSFDARRDAVIYLSKCIIISSNVSYDDPELKQLKNITLGIIPDRFYAAKEIFDRVYNDFYADLNFNQNITYMLYFDDRKQAIYVNGVITKAFKESRNNKSENQLLAEAILKKPGTTQSVIEIEEAVSEFHPDYKIANIRSKIKKILTKAQIEAFIEFEKCDGEDHVFLKPNITVEEVKDKDIDPRDLIKSWKQ